MRLAAVADLHGHLPRVPRCDLVLIAGDLPPVGCRDPEAQAAWLDSRFRAWLESAPADAVVGIAGNHDFVFAHPKLVPDELPWTYLQDESRILRGTAVWGSPWTPWFHGWAFNAPEENGESFLEDRYCRGPRV